MGSQDNSITRNFWGKDLRKSRTNLLLRRNTINLCTCKCVSIERVFRHENVCVCTYVRACTHVRERKYIDMRVRRWLFDTYQDKRHQQIWVRIQQDMSANTTRYECEYNKIRTYLDSKTDLVNPCSGEDADVPAWSWRQHVRFDCACGERKRKCVFGVKDSKGPFESRSLSRSLSFSLCLLFSLSFSLPLLLSLSLSLALFRKVSLSPSISLRY